MQTWKRKRPSRPPAPAAWKRPLIAALLLLATLASAVYDFPSVWNQGVAWAATQSGQDLSVLTLPESSYRLGLDLQGGTHLIYEADMSQIDAADRAEALEGVRDVIEKRVNAFGVSEPVVQTTASGGTYRVIVELAGVLDVEQAINEIGETPILEFKEVNTEVTREATPEEQVVLDSANATERAEAEAVLTRAKQGEDIATLQTEFSGDRLAAVTSEHYFYGPVATAIEQGNLGPGAIVPTLIETPAGLVIAKYIGPSTANQMELSHILICFEGKTYCENPIPAIEANIIITKLKSELTPENFADKAREYSTDPGSKEDGGSLGLVAPGDMVPAFELAAAMTPVGGISDAVETEFGYHIIYKAAEVPMDGYEVELVRMPFTTLQDIATPDDAWKNTGLSGKHLSRATVQYDQNVGTPYVSLQFDGEGAQLFEELTTRSVGKQIAIFLDGEAISTPVVNEPIFGGQAVIQGRFTLEEAKLLAQRLNAGALPVPINLVSQETVGPILGQASLEQSVRAGLLGFALVAGFMILVYRLPGLLAILALILYCFLNLAAYKLFGVTMSLSGIAGFVLSIGIAVDANVLIFERIRDEHRSGRDLRASIEEGFTRAWPPIRDGHLTTLISAGVLYSFSSSFVRGFALTLAIGVLLSLFTAIVVTRSYIDTLRRVKPLTHPALYSLKRDADSV